MRIGIDCRTILDEHAREKAGVAHYTYYLVKYLLKIDRQNTYVLFLDERTNSAVLQEIGEWGGKIELRKLRFSSYKRFLPYVYSHLLIANQIKAAKLDVFHSPANIVPLTLLRSKHRPKIGVTIHDLAIYRHPEWFPSRQGFSVKYLVPQTIKKVDFIIVPSHTTAEDIKALFGIPAGRISVIPHGVEERFFEGGDALPLLEISPKRKYFLFVGTIEPRKNLQTLVRVYASLAPSITSEYDLVLAGSLGWKYHSLLDQIAALPESLKGHIKLLGYYPGKDLPTLMKKAAIFVYPSLYEGFGLPVLEAMAAGTPVIASSQGSLPEIVGGQGKAGVLVEPHAPAQLAEVMEKLIRDDAWRAEMSAAGIEQARRFSWDRTAQMTLALYEKFLNK
jgi:glycosyltransferase involved in cell wall biosynthesis